MAALISLAGVSRHYQTGDTLVKALDNINLTIQRGEFVAIMGQSGSGKSTLMNIIGCLDRPSAGEYRIDGHDVSQLSTNVLSGLRLKTFGFVFQRYQLLPSYTALDNVAMPAVYSGMVAEQRRTRAAQLLARLGVGDRQGHQPAELSGGQQQRVSIARALINGAEVILADEPTGALDSDSGEQVLALLKELNQEGVSVILITHDAQVADHATRVIQLKDGRMIADRQSPGPLFHSAADVSPAGASFADASSSEQQRRSTPREFPSIATAECSRLAIRALRGNVFRTLLTLLGIIIGVASVVTMMSIGEGGKRQVLQRIESIGTNIIFIRPGGGNIRSAGDIATLTLADADALRRGLVGISGVAPERSGRATLRYGNNDYSGRLRGTTGDYFTVRDWQIARGTLFSQADVDSYAAVVVIGQTVADELFTAGEDPIGRYVLIQNAVYQVIGVLKKKGAGPSGDDMDDDVIMPISTAMLRLFGRNYLSSITIKADSTAAVGAIRQAAEDLLVRRHGKNDVMVRTTESLVATVTATANTLTWLLGAVAAISLFVGGIGVMNIMLVNVTERRREIGLRIATGAKPGDILRQFNIEALVVCLLGGVLGVIVGLLFSVLLHQLGMPVAYSLMPSVLAFSTCVLVGLLFGFAPARKASKLDPIAALADE